MHSTVHYTIREVTNLLTNKRTEVEQAIIGAVAPSAFPRRVLPFSSAPTNDYAPFVWFMILFSMFVKWKCVQTVYLYLSFCLMIYYARSLTRRVEGSGRLSSIQRIGSGILPPGRISATFALVMKGGRFVYTGGVHVNFWLQISN